MFGKKQQKAFDWKEAGKLLAWVVGIFTAVRNTLGNMGVGLEMIQWVNESGKETFAEWLKSLGQKFQEATREAAVPVTKQVVKLLEFIGTITIPATTEEFVIKDKLVVNAKDGARTNISYLGENFLAWFKDGVEEPVASQKLNHHKLTKQSVDGPIIAELGGEAKVATTLAEVYHLMCQQPNGEDGVLLNNGYANVFYVRIEGVLRTVDVSWYGYGWFVSAYSVEDPHGWLAGRQVFSRNFGS